MKQPELSVTIDQTGSAGVCYFILQALFQRFK